MKNLYIVTYYNEDNGQDWEPVIAESSEEAMDKVQANSADILGVTIDELGLYLTEFEAYKLDTVGDYKLQVIKK